MKTKILLLSAAALLAAGIASSRADGTVYSQNIVGYANVATPQSGIYYMMTVPFAIGASNGANEIWPNGALPDSSSLLIWNSGSQGFTTYIVDSGNGSSGWDDASYNAVPAPIITAGQGFYLNLAGANVTNVFAGTVAVNVGTSNNMVMPSSGIYYMVGSVVPYAGSVTNGNNSNGGVNLNGVPDSSSILIWNPSTQSFTTYISDSGNGSTGWDDASYNAVAPPSLTVGQAFYINLSGSYTWTTGL